jgi:hypothetical protein
MEVCWIRLSMAQTSCKWRARRSCCRRESVMKPWGFSGAYLLFNQRRKDGSWESLVALNGILKRNGHRSWWLLNIHLRKQSLLLWVASYVVLNQFPRYLSLDNLCSDLLSSRTVTSRFWLSRAWRMIRESWRSPLILASGRPYFKHTVIQE